jgi:hypothetical protein
VIGGRLRARRRNLSEIAFGDNGSAMDQLHQLTAWFDGQPRPFRLTVIAGVVTVAVVLSVIWGKWNSRRKLEHWAKAAGLQLVEWRGEPAWRGPRAWVRNDNHDDYEVLVVDRYGVKREGHVMFSRPWHGFGPEDVEVQWEET